jgi:hypothetical protein
MLASDSAPFAVTNDHGQQQRDPFGGYAARCTRKRILFKLLDDLRSTVLSLMKNTPEGKSRLQNNSRILCLCIHLYAKP